ncbi:MAG: glutamine-hydrolyzing carbamoyl-phosphate synthase small subunit [Candidatus Thiodiazotropha sp. (ex Epidulcina cf. delphinae)]|nr:glutamine-hydrolyzing carbamoyl-phosphate synthase small subunit [Candidatus Thiodiazotropha sp. (ex Epidulcina cf. delphinae)]
MTIQGHLILEDGTAFPGTLFGAEKAVAGEVVFNTGMVGYPEYLTDPSFAGQIVVATYPLVGNYGVPGNTRDENDLPVGFESETIQVSGFVISTLASDTSHWTAQHSLHEWMKDSGIPGIQGVDTRALAKRIRDKGAMLGKLVPVGEDIGFIDPNLTNLAARVSIREPKWYGKGNSGPRVILVDTGAKANIIRSLVQAGARVLRVPWDYDFFTEDFDGLFLCNGPGDPKMADVTVRNVKRAVDDGNIPIFGICLGNQLLALAAGADTYKLKFGHRGQNQPCLEVGTPRCYITSQNHGYAVNGTTLPEGWREWFTNANDGSNEGIRHEWKPMRSVQFHPEATPGPVDTVGLFKRFLEMIR